MALEAIRQGTRVPGMWSKAVWGLQHELWREAAHREWSAAGSVAADVVLWSDPSYPERLRELPDAPVLLYAKGDLSLLRSPSIGVVGTRRCSQQGKRDAAALAGSLSASGITVVSGMARGVDSVAHKAALSLPGGTIAVLGSGIDVIYPCENRELYERIVDRGLVVSEFVPGSRAEPRNFPIRNRLISGLSLGVLVIEASPGSGSLITARCALEQNRTVYAVGGQIGEAQSMGCQELIRQGAVPVFSHIDILRDLQGMLCRDGDVPLSFSLPPQQQTQRPWQDVAQGMALSSDALPDAFADTVSGELPSASGCSVRSSPVRRDRTSPRPALLPESKPVGTKDALHDIGSRVLVALAQQGPSDIDTLCDRLSLAPSDVSATLVLLEVRGSVVRRADSRYALV